MSGSIAQYITSARDNYAENSSVEFLLNSKNLGKSKKKLIFVGASIVAIIVVLIVIIVCSVEISPSARSGHLLSNGTIMNFTNSMDFSSNGTLGESPYFLEPK